MKSLKIVSASSVVIGLVIAAIAGILGWTILPNDVENTIRKSLIIQKEVSIQKETWKQWPNTSLSVQLKFYIFHIKNPDDVENNGSFPLFEEMGPYVYDEQRTMEKNTIERGSSIFYREHFIYQFNRSASYGDDIDEYDVINVPFLWLIQNANDIVPGAVATFATLLYRSGERIIKRNVSVRDLIFDGLNVTMYRDNSLFGYLVPNEFNDGLYGFYRERNNSDHGFYQINSGVDSSARLGEISEWNHKTSLGYWNKTGDSFCDMINGTDGTIFPPFVKKDRILKVFSSDWCRSIQLKYNSESEIMGVNSYRFTTQKELFEDPRLNEDNKCFCLKDNLTQCDYTGVLDISSCRGGGPFLVSLPHFLDGDEGYQNNASMKPIRESHQTLMDLEPNSGVLLNSNKRLQMNIRLQPYSTSDLLANLKEMVFPIFWVDESGSVDSLIIEDIETRFLKPIKRTNTIKWSLLGIGFFFTIAGSATFFLTT